MTNGEKIPGKSSCFYRGLFYYSSFGGVSASSSLRVFSRMT